MAKTTNKQVEEVLEAIEELRTCFVTFEHIVDAHLSVLSERVQHLHQNIRVQTDEQNYKQLEKNSTFAIQSPIQPFKIYEVQKLPVQQLVNRQLNKSDCSSPGYTEEEESPCPLPKALKWPQSEDKREQRTKYFKNREQSVAIPSKRENPVNDGKHKPSGEVACPPLNPQVSSQKQSETDCVKPPASRSKHPSAKSNASFPNGQALTTHKRPPLPNAEKPITKSSSISKAPIIKLEERRMWKTIWNAEGSKEPLDQYIVRKRSEIMYRLPKVRANAVEKAVAVSGKNQAELAASQNKNTNNAQNNEEQSRSKEKTKKFKSSSTTQNHSSPTNQQTSSQNHTNNHAKIGIESLPRKDKSVCDQPAALKRTPTENPQAKAKSTKKKRVCSNSDSTGNEGDNTTKKKRKATEKDLFYNSSTEDTISPKSVDLDGLMKNFGAQKRIG